MIEENNEEDNHDLSEEQQNSAGEEYEEEELDEVINLDDYYGLSGSDDEKPKEKSEKIGLIKENVNENSNLEENEKLDDIEEEKIKNNLQIQSEIAPSNANFNDKNNKKPNETKNHKFSDKKNFQSQQIEKNHKNEVNNSNRKFQDLNVGSDEQGKTKIKTVFSILSEEILEKVMKNKKTKINTYDIMINELEIQKIKKKISTNSNKIADNFIARNMEDAKLRKYKKSLNSLGKQEQNKQNINSKQNNALSTLPEHTNSDNFNMTEENTENKANIKKNIRTANKFFADQLEWMEAKRVSIVQEREKQTERIDNELQSKPKINQKSNYFAKLRSTNKKNDEINEIENANFLKSLKNRSNNRSSDTHSKLNKLRTGIFKINKEEDYKNLNSVHRKKGKNGNHNSKIQEGKEKTKEKVKSYSVESRYNKINKNQLEINMNKNEEISQNNVQICEKSNIIMLRKFLQKISDSIEEENLPKSNYDLNKEFTIGDYSRDRVDSNPEEKKLIFSLAEFEKILYKTGFIKYEHPNISDEFVNESDIDSENLETLKSIRKELEKMKSAKNLEEGSDNIFIRNELTLIKLAWRILLSQNKCNSKIDLNLILIFLLAILGIYKGDLTNMIEKNSKKKKANQKKKYLRFKGKEKQLKLKINKENSNKLLANQMRIDKTDGENFMGNINHQNENNQDKNLSITFAKSSEKNKTIQKHDYKNKLMEKNPNLSKFNKEKESDDDKKILYLKIIIKEVKNFFPKFQNLNFAYSPFIINSIRKIFMEFYNNWSEKNLESIKSKWQASAETQIKNQLQFSYKPKISKKTYLYANKYRSKENNCFNMNNIGIKTNVSNNLTTNISINSENLEENIKNFTNINKVFSESNIIKERKKAKVEELYDKLNLRKEKELDNLRAEKLKKEMEGCTFIPQSNEKNTILLKAKKLNSKEITERLYTDAKEKLGKKNKNNEEKNMIDESYKQYPYTPKINNLQRKIFEKKPTKEDILTQVCYERYEKSRIDRKLKDIITKTGSNTSSIKNIQNYLDQERKDENIPRLRFDIEEKSFKNTLTSKFKIKENEKVKTTISNIANSKISDENQQKILENTIENFCNFSEINEKKINLDIYLSKNKKINYEFLTNQDPAFLTEKFCIDNEIFELTEQKKKEIFDQINEELMKYYK